MSDKIHVLVYPAGEQNSSEAILALSRHVNVGVYGCGARDRLAPFLLSHYVGDFPTVHDPSFVERMNALIDEWGIDLILPTHDSVVDYLARRRADVKAIPMVPSAATSDICRDKARFYREFDDCSFVPETFAASDAAPAQVWVKPRVGQGGVGGRLVDTDAKGWRSGVDWDTEIVTEYLPGQEITVDCFSDRDSIVQGVFPRSRDETLGGISVAGRTMLPSEEISQVAEHINSRLGFVGMWYFQARESASGNFKVMEVSARVPGGQALTRARGVNLPLLSVYAHLGMATRVFENALDVGYRRVLTSLFDTGYKYRRVYLDLDDTLLVDGRPNPDVLQLLYQWTNDRTKVTLLTRHEGIPAATLDDHRIHRGLFDEIVHLTAGQKKSTFITDQASIFIDNAFEERAEVHDARGIPVFDVSETDVLRNWQR